jgi:prefoldin subunit 5
MALYGGDSKMSNSSYYAIVVLDSERGPEANFVVFPLGPKHSTKLTGMEVDKDYFAFYRMQLTPEKCKEIIRNNNPDRYDALVPSSTVDGPRQRGNKRKVTTLNDPLSHHKRDHLDRSQTEFDKALGDKNFNKMSASYNALHKSLEASKHKIKSLEAVVTQQRNTMLSMEKDLFTKAEMNAKIEVKVASKVALAKKPLESKIEKLVEKLEKLEEKLKEQRVRQTTTPKPPQSPGACMSQADLLAATNAHALAFMEKMTEGFTSVITAAKP